MYQFINNLKSDKAFFFYRGSVAFYALLKAMGIQPGDEVILQVFTCDAVPATIVRAGGVPVFVDIDPHTFNLDPGKIEARLTEKTRAILVQHTYGIPAEMDRILEIARKHNLRVFEDSCHALGSRYCGQEVGTFGDGAFYSFGWHKPLVLGVGGAAIANDHALKQEMTRIYGHFTTPSKKDLIALYTQYFVYNFLLTPSLFWPARRIYRKLSRKGIIAGTFRPGKLRTAQTERKDISHNEQERETLGRKIIPYQEQRLFRRLDKFENAVAHHDWIVSQYQKLVSLAGYSPLALDSRFEPVLFKYPLLSNNKKEIFEAAPQARIELSYIFASPLYPHDARMAARWRSFGYRQGMCPISEDVADRIVALPVHTKIQARDIEKITAFLASFH